MSYGKNTFINLCSIFLQVVLCLLSSALGAQPQIKTPLILVSKETTIITTPLLANGLPDYVSYFNKKYVHGRDFDKSKNAAFAVFDLFGADSFYVQLDDPAKLNRLQQSLGGEVARKPQCHWLPLHELDENTVNLEREYRAALKLGEFLTPDKRLLDWVKSNNGCLKMYSHLAAFDTLFLPWISNKPLAVIKVPRWGYIDEVNIALLAKLSNAVADEDINTAIELLRDMLSVGHLISQSPDVMSWIIGTKLITDSYLGFQSLASKFKLSRQQSNYIESILSNQPAPISISYWYRVQQIYNSFHLISGLYHSQHYPSKIDYSLVLRAIVKHESALFRVLIINDESVRFAAYQSLVDEFDFGKRKRVRVKRAMKEKWLTLLNLCRSSTLTLQSPGLPGEDLLSRLYGIDVLDGVLSCKDINTLKFMINNYSDNGKVHQDWFEREIRLFNLVKKTKRLFKLSVVN